MNSKITYCRSPYFWRFAQSDIVEIWLWNHQENYQGNNCGRDSLYDLYSLGWICSSIRHLWGTLIQAVWFLGQMAVEGLTPALTGPKVAARSVERDDGEHGTSVG